MPKARVLIVDDEELISWSLQRDLARQGFETAVAAEAEGALAQMRADPADVVLLDINLPGRSGMELLPELRSLYEHCAVVMITSVTSIDAAVEAMRHGAFDYVTKPFDFPRLYNAVAKAAEQVVLLEQNRALRDRRPAGGQRREIVCASAAMRRVLELAGYVMRNPATVVLLLGESGTGKDLLARHIHDGSPERERLFLDLNCASIPETLLESELFGHERGAFTDARALKKGLLELADGGTVFLDEIADTPLAVQPKLLKVIEHRTFRRLGGSRDIHVDVRIICAANRRLEEAVADRSLREDLYYRLKVFPIEIPPLRERTEDILPLARFFLAHFNRQFHKQIPEIDPRAAERLCAYGWPGNVRELRNVIERAMILAAQEALSLDLLPPEIFEASPRGPAEPLGALAAAEASLLREALVQTQGNQSRAAEILGISRDALRRRMRRYGLP